MLFEAFEQGTGAAFSGEWREMSASLSLGLHRLHRLHSDFIALILWQVLCFRLLIEVCNEVLETYFF